MSEKNLLNDSFPKHKDGHLLGLKEDSSKLEISLNTTGYKPEELKVNISDDEVKVEGKHEERSEDGELMVERNFCKTYTLPHGAVKEKVESNLSDDGVMVISVPKKKHIKEVNGVKNIKVEQDEKERQMNVTNRRMNDFGGSAEIQRGRRSHSKTRMSRESSVVRQVEEFMKKSETKERKEEIRNTFLDDPFFKNSLSNIENTDFLKKARHNFEESIEQLESRLTNSMNIESSKMRSEEKWINPRISNADFDSIFDHKDTNTIEKVEDDTKLEIRLDTTGYRYDELEVKTKQGMITVKGRHEEKDESGEARVTKQFQRQFQLPQGSLEEEVFCSLTKEGVLIVTVPKQRNVRHTVLSSLV